MICTALNTQVFLYPFRCSVCGNESDSSKNLVDFYELEVNVKGFEGLEASLDDYLGEELLEGDNQYMCEHCNARVDATRSVKLRSLPPLLNFQLKRFVFNNKVRVTLVVLQRESIFEKLVPGKLRPLIVGWRSYLDIMDRTLRLKRS